jgi:hypothetical protein
MKISKKCEAPWSSEIPIAELFARIEDCKELAEAGQDPISEVGTVRIAYNIIFATGRFTEPCRAWRALPEEEQTWPNFQLKLTEANRESAGYHGANAVSDARFQKWKPKYLK